MTTYVEARDAIVTRLEGMWHGAYPSVPLMYDNTSVNDVDRLTEFLGCEISFFGGEQADIGADPILRTHGNLTFVIAVKEATGARKSLARADVLAKSFRFKKFGGVQMQAPHPLPPKDAKGWYITELIIPFYFDG